MADAKHTPGPWRASTKYPNIIIRDYLPIDDAGELIASICGHDNSGYFPDEAQALANALLIAAAPELLEALQDILASSMGDPNKRRVTEGRWTTANVLSDRIAAARAAVSKAIGSAQ